MSDELELFVPPDCAIGDAEARAIVESSRAADAFQLTDADAIRVRTSTLCRPGRVYVIDRSALDPQSPPLATRGE